MELRRPVAIPLVVAVGDTTGAASIGAAALLSSGEVVVADNKTHHLSWFSPTGRRTWSIALRSERNEAIYASWIESTKSGAVLAYDQPHGMVYRISRSRNAKIPERMFALPFPTTALCRIDSNLIAIGVHDGSLVHVLSMTGQLRRSFGELLGSSIAQQPVLSVSSRALCVPQLHAILVSYDVLGVVDAYRIDGVLMWTHKVPGFHGLDVRSYPNGTVTFGKSSGPVDGIRSIFLVTPATVGIQVARGGRPDSAARRSWTLESQLIDVVTGREVAVQSKLPEVAFATDKYLVVVDYGEPPSLSLFPFIIRVKQ